MSETEVVHALTADEAKKIFEEAVSSVESKGQNIKNIAAALSEFQGELETAKKDSTNPFFKSNYSDLRSVWNVIREPLAKNGLAVTQIPTIQGDRMVLITRVLHVSGEVIESIYPINPVKNDPQGMGSAVTYARRYALTAILGVVSGDDDDANGASGNESLKEPQKKKRGRPKNSDRFITLEEQKEFHKTCQEYGKKEDEVKKYLRETFGKASTSVIPKGTAFESAITWAQGGKVEL